MKLRISCVVVGFLALVLSLVQLTFAQTTTQTPSALPRLVRLGGTVKNLNGTPLTGVVGITFAFYSEQTGGAALWLETQNVTADTNGRYTALLGSTKPEGLPPELFTSEQARWVGVQVSGQPEQPRVLLVSAPYALKAGDAETVGGLPPSAFVLAAPSAGMTSTAAPTAPTATEKPPLTGTTPVTTAGGTVNKLAKFDANADITNSQVFDNGTNVGIGNTAPAAKLDVSGSGIFRGALSLPATGTANVTAGTNSQPFNFTASSFSSSTKAAVNETFRWQAEPTGNNTATPLGKLNLLFGSGTATPAETGLSLSNKGVITFASGQTFPASVGTVKSVGLSASSSDFTVSGSPVTTSGTLALNWKVAPTNADTANAIVKRDANGSFTAGAITANLGMEGVTTNASGNGVAGINNGGGTAVYGGGNTGVGVWGESFGTGPVSDGVHGVTSSAAGSGVAGVNNSGAVGSVGVYGSGGTGVYGIGTAALFGTAGVVGISLTPSSTGTSFGQVALWGDTGDQFSIGVLATVDDSFALQAYSNSVGKSTMYAENLETTDSQSSVFVAHGGGFSGDCRFDVSGSLFCNGSKSAVVPVDGGTRKVALYAIEGPENWFEDIGTGHLVNGAAVVTLEATFAQTVNTELDYHVFLTPNGDCKGLYVTGKTPTSFEVRELGAGTSSLAFDYRVVAKRKGYENIRLADKTRAFEVHGPARRPASPAPALVKPALPAPRSVSVNQLPNR